MVLTLFKGIAGMGYLYLVVYSTLCTAAPILMLNLSGLFLNAHEISILCAGRRRHGGRRPRAGSCPQQGMMQRGRGVHISIDRGGSNVRIVNC